MPEGKSTDILVLQPFRKRFSKHALRNRQRPSTGPPFFVTATNDDVIASPSSPSFRRSGCLERKNLGPFFLELSSSYHGSSPSRPEACKNIAMHASPAARTSIFPNSAFPLYSTSLLISTIPGPFICIFSKISPDFSCVGCG